MSILEQLALHVNAGCELPISFIEKAQFLSLRAQPILWNDMRSLDLRSNEGLLSFYHKAEVNQSMSVVGKPYSDAHEQAFLSAISDKQKVWHINLLAGRSFFADTNDAVKTANVNIKQKYKKQLEEQGVSVAGLKILIEEVGVEGAGLSVFCQATYHYIRAAAAKDVLTVSRLKQRIDIMKHSAFNYTFCDFSAANKQLHKYLSKQGQGKLLGLKGFGVLENRKNNLKLLQNESGVKESLEQLFENVCEKITKNQLQFSVVQVSVMNKAKLTRIKHFVKLYELQQTLNFRLIIAPPSIASQILYGKEVVHVGFITK